MYRSSDLGKKSEVTCVSDLSYDARGYAILHTFPQVQNCFIYLGLGSGLTCSCALEPLLALLGWTFCVLVATGTGWTSCSTFCWSLVVACVFPTWDGTLIQSSMS